MPRLLAAQLQLLFKRAVILHHSCRITSEQGHLAPYVPGLAGQSTPDKYAAMLK